jgi:hypothetical protein
MTGISRAIGALCIAAVATIGSSAHAQTVGETWDSCRTSDDPDAAIAACTAIINSGYGDANLRSSAYGFRAVAYEEKHQDDLAIADYREALQLNPNNEGADLGLKSILADQ